MRRCSHSNKLASNDIDKHVRNHDSRQWYDIVSFHGFAFGFPERPHTNGDVFLTYKPMINPLIS